VNRVKLIMEIDANNASSMSTQINAEQALDLARSYVNKAGYAFYFIEEVKHEGPNWVVRAGTLNKKLVMTISDRGGELLELKSVDG
jgi:hypothetical protein